MGTRRDALGSNCWDGVGICAWKCCGSGPIPAATWSSLDTLQDYVSADAGLTSQEGVRLPPFTGGQWDISDVVQPEWLRIIFDGSSRAT